MQQMFGGNIDEDGTVWKEPIQKFLKWIDNYIHLWYNITILKDRTISSKKMLTEVNRRRQNPQMKRILFCVQVQRVQVG